MKKGILSSLIALLFLVLLQPVHAISSSAILPSSTPVEKIDPNERINNMLVEQYLSLTPQKYYELTGKKLKLSQKVSLKLSQWKIKRMLKKGKKVDLLTMAKAQKELDTSDFNIAGFLLGLFLSLIGVLIAYLIGGDDIIKWAWLGAGLNLIIFLLAVLL
jgi:hypothetical protein